METLVIRIKKRQPDRAFGRRFPARANGSRRALDVRDGAESLVAMVKSLRPSLLWLMRTKLFLARSGAPSGVYAVRDEKGIVRLGNKSLAEPRRRGTESIS
ncbi:hypothetical protein D623_10028810 [Myotis brandtii]|uniref:Uncharacterized protein n=1 Tax=Myotis brandtii TaxID=109478 RepID=S7N945_MYOBR|nr:hypothetical protein D623_10028810 [Myotis brandtii]